MAAKPSDRRPLARRRPHMTIASTRRTATRGSACAVRVVSGPLRRFMGSQTFAYEQMAAAGARGRESGNYLRFRADCRGHSAVAAYMVLCRGRQRERNAQIRRGDPPLIHNSSTLAICVFLFFVAVVLGISFYLGAKAKSAQGYFAAHGRFPGLSTAWRSRETTSRPLRSSASAA